MSACSSCGARVMWVVTTAGRLMPLDARQSPDGNVRLTGQKVPHPKNPSAPLMAEAEVLTNRSIFDIADDTETATPLYLPHFATCPNADRHRTRKEQRR